MYVYIYIYIKIESSSWSPVENGVATVWTHRLQAYNARKACLKQQKQPVSDGSQSTHTRMYAGLTMAKQWQMRMQIDTDKAWSNQDVSSLQDPESRALRRTTARGQGDPTLTKTS